MSESSPPTEAASTGPTATSNGHLSIGEVLALLLEEFPDVTISKIRFLESQGLIDPERTASGYRKFYDDDVELLRCILREQRENYLPLRVIKDRIDSGQIDPTNETPRPELEPRGIKNVGASDAGAAVRHPSSGGATSAPAATGADALFARTDGGPVEATESVETPDTADTPVVAAAPANEESEPSRGNGETVVAGAILPGLLLSADEFCGMAGISREQLADLESYGVLSAESGGSSYDEVALEIATHAKRFLDAGIEARHLRGWRVAADREAGLLEQLIQPMLRQRNPAARAEAVAELEALERSGGELRSALMRDALRHHLGA